MTGFRTTLPWKQSCCHGNNTATTQGASLGVSPKLKLWCQVSNTFPYYLQRYCRFCDLTSYQNDWWCHQLSNLHNAKTWISLEQKKVLQKRNHCPSSLLKAFQMRLNYFLLHRHFKKRMIFFPQISFSQILFSQIFES